MATIKVQEQRLVDFSFIPSLKCNLSCQHCMYDASSSNPKALDMDKTGRFISTIDYSKINAMGFYGGEISCDYERYRRVIDLIPEGVIKFTITNGTWSRDRDEAQKFIDFVKQNGLRVFISNTRFHRPFQDASLLEKIAREQGFAIKEEDDIIPMGRAGKDLWKCSEKCRRYSLPMRLTLNPDGKVMFLNCDGRYPVIGTYDETFSSILDRCPKPGEN